MTNIRDGTSTPINGTIQRHFRHFSLYQRVPEELGRRKIGMDGGERAAMWG
jgi:hypothetical protein